MYPTRLFAFFSSHRNSVRLLGGLVLCVGLAASARGADIVESFLEPYRTIDVAATESGIVDKMEVVEGQDVSRDQPLVRLDQDIHKAALEIARRAMEGQGQINAAKSELTLATTRHKKLLSLRERDHATAEEVGRAEMELALADAKLLIAKETLEIRAAEYDRYRIQLDRRTIRSPISGVVIRVHRDEGEFINPAEPLVVTIVQLDPLIATFSVPESKVSAFSSNPDVKVRVAGTSRIAPAQIEFVSPVVSAQTATVTVKVKISNSEGKFRAGERCHLVLGDAPVTRVAPTPAPTATPTKAAPPEFAPAAASSARSVSDQRTKPQPAPSAAKSEPPATKGE
jgi:RND family efflux transporter MFP subunit